MNTQGIIGHKQQIIKLESILHKNMIPHTLLFSGISGIGKKRLALNFLNALFCKSETAPCFQCKTCLEIKSGTFSDIIVLSPNDKGKIPIGNSDKKEEGSVRWLIDRLNKRSLSGTYGIIIDGVDTISIEGQNALLKTIEEPQEGTYIILIVSNKSRILPTILSRAASIPFYPLTVNAVEKILNNSNISHENAQLAAEFSGGSVETAQLLLEGTNLENILSLAEELTGYLMNGSIINSDMQMLQKSFGTEDLINILVNIYRFVCIGVIKGFDNKVTTKKKIENIIIDDIEKLQRLIKILLALRKGLTNNLNLKHALKGMLYTIDNMQSIEIPFAQNI